MITRVFAMMYHHATPLRETPSADIAHVGPLARMGEPVDSEHAQLGVTRQANFALVRFLTGVLTDVRLE